ERQGRECPSQIFPQQAAVTHNPCVRADSPLMSSLSFSSPISKLKVLMAESSPNFGGQQYRLVRETLWLRANGHEPLVLCGTHSRLAHHLAHHARSVPVSKIDAWQSPLALAALFRIARRWRPDVIHVRSSQDSFWGSFLHATGWPVVR